MDAIRTAWRACGLALLLLLLGGCVSAYSTVPAITEASRTEETPPLQPGRYCLSADEDGAMDIELGSCVVLLDVGPGTFTLAGEDPENPGPFTIELAELPRGVHLAQTYLAEEERYDLYLIMMTMDAAAVIEVGEQTSEIEALARESGVTLATRTGPEEVTVGPGEPPPAPPEPVENSEPTTSGQVFVFAGEPDAVLDFMRKVSDSIFVEARESAPAEDDEFPIDVLPLFRVGTSVEESQLDEAGAIARIEALRAIIEQAIALE